MKTIWIAAASAALSMAAAASAAVPASDDRNALERLASAADQAWNRGDAEGMSILYTESASLRLGGMDKPLVGRGAVRSYFGRSFEKRPPGFRHVTQLRHVEMLGPSLAFSDAAVSVEQSDGKGGWLLVRQYENNSIAVREAGQWKLSSVRAYPVPEPAKQP